MLRSGSKSGALTASKGKGFLLYNILCVFIYRSSLDQLSSLLTYMPKSTSSHTQTQCYLVYVEVTPHSLSESDRSAQDLLSESSLIAGLTESRQRTSWLAFVFFPSFSTFFFYACFCELYFAGMPGTKAAQIIWINMWWKSIIMSCGAAEISTVKSVVLQMQEKFLGGKPEQNDT